MTRENGYYVNLFNSLEYKIDNISDLDFECSTIVKNKDRYIKVQEYTGIPYFVVGIIHDMEASFDFKCYLGNGEPLNKVTKLVPKGRGPFDNWETGVIDVFEEVVPDMIPEKWDIEDIGLFLESYNGFGYEKRLVNSPYLWSKSNHYYSGYYKEDGVYDEDFVSQQIGGMVLLKRLMETGADLSCIGLTREELKK